MLLRGAEIMSLRDKVAVTGIGETLYQRGSTRSSTELQLRAGLTAIADAGLTPREIDGIIPIGITGASAEEIATNLGLEELRYSALTPMGGASSIAAIQTAAAAISTGLCNHVLIAAGRNVSAGAKAGARIHTMPQFHLITEFELPLGAIAPAQLYAPMARRHMELFGTTSEQMGEVAVAARAHALLNDNAIMKQPITLEDHQASRMIADPFRLLDCSLESDGGAAFVISAADSARSSGSRADSRLESWRVQTARSASRKRPPITRLPPPACRSCSASTSSGVSPRSRIIARACRTESASRMPFSNLPLG
jgi:acetyl-CoA acetyltransferase